MKNYNEKQRDMIRSVLPSTRRTYARYFKRDVNKSHRRRVKLAISGWNDDWTEPERDFYEHDGLRWEDDQADSRIHNADSDYERYIKYVMWERRDGDKLAAIQRWAVKRTAHLPIEERRPFMDSKLNKTPMGRHAMTHIETLEEFYVPDKWNYYPYFYEDREDRYFLQACEWARLVPMMKFIVRNGLQNQLAYDTNALYAKRTEGERFVIQYSFKDFYCETEEDIIPFLSRKRFWQARYYGQNAKAFVDALGAILLAAGVEC